MDTPGLHSAKHKLGEFLNQEAQEALDGVDLILWLVDASSEPTEDDIQIAGMLNKVAKRTPRLLVLNKIDALKADEESAREKTYSDLLSQAPLRKCPQRSGLGLGEMMETLISLLPERPAEYPEEQITDLYEREIAGDLIREACLLQLRDEVPHSVAVRIDEFTERENGMVYIGATIFVERNHKKASSSAKAAR